MAADLLSQFLDVDQGEATTAPATLGESFGRGVRAGAETLDSDASYFSALVNASFGDDQSAEEALQRGREAEQRASGVLAGIPEFSQFVDEPTVGGFFNQIAKFSGQTSANLATSVLGGGIGGVLGRSIGTTVGKKAIERIARDSVDRTVKGVATPDEKLIAEAAYDYAKRGAFTGAFGAEYVPASAGAARDALESGEALDGDTALRAFMVGAPVAGVGVAGEAALLKIFGNVAAKRAAKEGSIFETVSKRIAGTTGKSAGVEGVTEVVQEGALVGNRALLDDSFTRQDAYMRLGEAAFAGFFSGGALGAAGGIAGSAASNAPAVASNLAPVAAEVSTKARDLLNRAQSQIFNTKVNEEQFGADVAGQTTRESDATIDAQLRTLFDPTSNKTAVWDAGPVAERFKDVIPEDGTVVALNLDGKRAFAAYVPGRGVIFGRRQIVEQVAAEGASDSILAEALGYSSVKTADMDLVVQALDEDGFVISEEAATKDGVDVAIAAANLLVPQGGSVRTSTVEKALEQRREAVEAQRPLKTQDEMGFEYEGFTPEDQRVDLQPSPEPESKAKIKARREIAKQMKALNKLPKFGQIIAGYGGLNQNAWKAETGLSKKDSGNLKGGFGRPFWRSKDSGLTPEQLAERLQEDGYIPDYDRNQAIELVEDLLFVGDRFVDGEAVARLVELEEAEAELERPTVRGMDLTTTNVETGEVISEASADGASPSRAGQRVEAQQEREFDEVGERLNLIAANPEEFGLDQETQDALVRLNVLYQTGDVQAKARIVEALQKQRGVFARRSRAEDARQQMSGAPDVASEMEYSAGKPESNVQLVNEESVEIATFKRKRDPDEMFPDTQQLRDEYDEVFGPQDWSDEFYGGMNESLLRNAISEQQRFPSSRMEINEFMGIYTLNRVGDATVDANLGQESVVAEAVSLARRGNFAANSQVTINGGPKNVPAGTKINFVTLVNAGRRIAASRGIALSTDPTTQARAGFIEIVSELIEQGYNVEINGTPLADILNDPRLGAESRILGDVVVAIVDGAEVSLRNLLRGDTKGQQAARQSLNAEIASRQANRLTQLENRANAEFDLATGRTSPATPDVTADNYTIANQNPRFTPRYKWAVETDQDGNRRFVLKPVSTASRRPQGAVNSTLRAGEPNETLSDTQSSQEIISEPDASGQTDIVPRTRLNTEVEKVAFNINRDRGPATPATGTGGLNRPSVVDNQDSNAVRWTESVDSDATGASQRTTPEGEVADNLTRMLQLEIPNWMGEEPASTKPVSGNPKRSKAFGGTFYPAGSIGSLATQVLNRASKALRLRVPVAVMGVKELAAMSDADFSAMFGDAFVAQTVRLQLRSLLESDNALGRYIGFKDTHVILVDNRTSNQLQTSLAVAHELGHALYQEERTESLAKPAVRERLLKDFRRALAGDDVPESYKGEFGFEEWFSDQVGSWAQSTYLNEKRPAKNMVDRTFKQIAERLIKMFKALSTEMRRRFGKEARSFEAIDFIETVAERNRERFSEVSSGVNASPLRGASYDKKAIVRRMEESVAKDPKAQKAVLSIAEQVRKVMYSDRVAPLTRLLLPEDNILRNISPTIADFFYVRSQSAPGTGFLNAKTNARNKILNDIEDAIGDDWNTQEVLAGFEQAATDTPTSELDGKARQIRDFLDNLYDNYIGKVPGVKIGRRENYFPVGLDLAKIYADPEAFVQTVLKYTEASPSYIRKVVDRMVQQQQNILDDTVEIDFVATNPLTTIEEARQLTQDVPPQELTQFSLPPDEAFLKYIRHIVIRTEFKRATTDRDGNDVLGPALNQLSAKDQEEAKRIIERYLGYTNTPINPKLQAVNGWMQMFNWVTLLPLATISSIPELGGAILNFKEFSGVTEAMKQTIATIKNREDAEALARDLGVTVSSTMANLGLTDADDEFLDPRVRKWSDKFFDGIGLSQFTRFTREFASNMSVQFVLRHAAGDNGNPRSARYLSKLGVTAEQVNRWYASQSSERGLSFDGEDGQAVREALTRFVESSMLRPNAAERPAWGNDPRFALIWQLKSFLYSFSKVIIGGLKREAGNRLAEGDTALDKIGGVGYQLALAGVAFMPLAMLSLELRELTKYVLAKTLPGVDANPRYFRTDRMDWPEYMGEIFDRAGYAGPFAIFGMMSQSAEWGDTGLSPILGPTYGFFVDDVALGLMEGKGLDIIPERIIPGYNIVL